jgi:hypothetical protein
MHEVAISPTLYEQFFCTKVFLAERNWVKSCTKNLDRRSQYHHHYISSFLHGSYLCSFLFFKFMLILFRAQLNCSESCLKMFVKLTPGRPNQLQKERKSLFITTTTPLTTMHPGLKFTNILRTAFLYKSCAQNFFVLTF